MFMQNSATRQQLYETSMIYQSTDYSSAPPKEAVKKVVKKQRRKVLKTNTEGITERKQLSELKLDEIKRESEKVTEDLAI